MLLRTLYAIKESWHFRTQLKRYLLDASLQVASVRDLQLSVLRAHNIQALVLDYDGVLAAHGEPTPRPENTTWLQEFSRAYAPHKIFILSNKPNPERIAYFQQNFPTITFVKATRKKPYPDGLQQIMTLTGLPAAQIMLVDDRLCTGILAALITGVQGVWVTVPYINLRNRPFAESGFMFLRWLERTLIGYLVPKPLPS